MDEAGEEEGKAEVQRDCKNGHEDELGLVVFVVSAVFVIFREAAAAAAAVVATDGAGAFLNSVCWV